MTSVSAPHFRAVMAALFAGLWLGGCIDRPPTESVISGALRVTAVTLGAPADHDPDGYTFQIDGGPWMPLPAGDWTELRLGLGEHSVALGGAAPNCAVGGANPRTATVQADQIVQVSFAVACQAHGLQWPGVVSDPVPGGGASAMSSGTSPFAADDVGVVYVSLPPGTIPNGERMSIRNRTTGDTVAAVMSGGGLDPVQVRASAGDLLDMQVWLTGAITPLQFANVVTAKRPPIVVRTNPPPKKRDVPLNSVMIVVFSEPIDPATLSATTMYLLDGQTSIAGRLEFTDEARLTAALVPDAPLTSGTDYQLVVTTGIEDLDGDALEAPVFVEFTSAPPVALMQVSPDVATIVIGDTVQLTAAVYDGAGNDLVDRSVAWAASNPAVATVTMTGLVTALGVGTVQIVASAESMADTASITVTDVPVASLSVTPPADTLLVSDSLQLSAVARDAAGNVLQNRVVSWRSADSTIASVTSGGRVRARAAGTAEVIGSVEGQADTATITVLPLPPSPATQLVFTVQPVNGTAGALLAPAVKVAAQNAVGTIDPAFNGDITLWLRDGTLLGTTTVSAVAGVATFSDLRINKAFALHRLSAMANGIPQTTYSDEFAISPAAATQLSFPSQPAATTPGAPISVRVDAQDVFQNHAAAFTGDVTVAIGANPGGGALTGTTTVAAVAGSATFTDLRIDRPGAGYTLVASATELSSAMSATFGVASPVVASVTVTPDTVIAVPIYPNVALRATLKDASGVEVTGVPVSWVSSNPSIASLYLDDTSDGTPVGMFWPQGPVGSVTITATAGGRSGIATLVVDSVRLSAVAARGNGGLHSTCFLTVAGAAYCLGNTSQFGELGYGFAGTPPLGLGPVAVTGGHTFAAISAGIWHTCALTPSGSAYCWGGDWRGQLGAGGGLNRCNPGDDGGALCSHSPIAVSGGLAFAQISAGSQHTCGLTAGGIAYCWGANHGGQLGNGTNIDSPVPVAVAGGLTFTQLSAGSENTCGVTGTGAGYCWGGNESGELGDGTLVPRWTPVPVVGGLGFAQVTAGGHHSCGVTTSGAAYCWGHNFYSQLGSGTGQDSPVPVPVAGGLAFSQISAGYTFTCGLAGGDNAFCWGWPGGWTAEYDYLIATEPTRVSGSPTFVSLDSKGLPCGMGTNGLAYCWVGFGPAAPIPGQR